MSLESPSLACHHSLSELLTKLSASICYSKNKDDNIYSIESC